MAQKKILVICQHFWPEAFRINDICDYFIEQGCEVDVLCGIPNYPKGQFFPGYSYFHNRRQRHNGVGVYRAFEIPRGNNSSARIFLNYISFPIASIMHVPHLLTKKYDKIFLYQLSPVMMAIAGIIIGKIKRVETTMYVLDLWPENLFSVLKIHNNVLRSFATRISHWHYRRVDKIIALSETMKKHLSEVTGLGNIAVIPQAAEKVYEQEIIDPELNRRFKNGFNIVFTGNISPAQSFETIITAAKMLATDGITDINWIIVGDGMSRKSVEVRVRNSGLGQSFFFEGHKPIADIPKYTGIADLLIGCLVKSDLLEATIPAKVMSYLASGKAMVLAMDGEVRDLVNDIGCGAAGPAGDARALYKNIKMLYLMPPTEREAMGERARSYHFANFERNIVLNKLYNFIFQ